MAPILTKTELLKLITNPLMRGFFEKNAEKASQSAPSAEKFVKSIQNFNSTVSIGISGKALIDYFKNNGVFSYSPTSKLTADEELLAKKIDVIQTMIDDKKPITEALISKEVMGIKPLDVSRVEFAIENVKTKASPHALIDKIFQAIDNSYSDDTLCKLQALRDYALLENTAAKETSAKKPFSERVVTALDNQIEKLTKLSELRQDLTQFKAQEAIRPQKETSVSESKQETKEEQSTSMRRRMP